MKILFNTLFKIKTYRTVIIIKWTSELAVQNFEIRREGLRCHTVISNNYAIYC